MIRNHNEPVYKLSFVMPVYNAEDYLEEAIESVVQQSIGFSDNIQLILVNDGSTDGSAAILEQYKKRYPDNVVCITQKNKGVSVARNAGLRLVKGKYISFLDSDDLISLNTADEVYQFFETHYDEIDVVSIRMDFFEAKTGPHMLNYKYKKTRIIDIQKEYDHIQLAGGSSFVKTEAIKGKYTFDENLKVTEDAKFLTEIILNKMAYGVVAAPIYYYRKRYLKNSAISSSESNRSWYLDTPQRAYLYLLQMSKERFGFVPKYVQYLVAYDLQWRLTQSKQTTLNNNEETAYKASLVNILQYIDDDILLEQKQVYLESKLFMISLKHGQNVLEYAERVEDCYYRGDTLLYNYLEDNQSFVAEIFEIKENKVTIEGYVRGAIFSGVKFGFCVGDRFIEASKATNSKRIARFLGQQYFDGNFYRATFTVRFGEHVVPTLNLVSGANKGIAFIGAKHSRMPLYNSKSYRAAGKYLVCQTAWSRLEFVKRTKLMRTKKELDFIVSMVISILRRGRQPVSQECVSVVPEAVVSKIDPLAQQHTLRRATGLIRKVAETVIVTRLAYFVAGLCIRKAIWIISDRVDAAGDNGEAFFRYVMQQPGRGIRKYFAISKNSTDYKRMRQYGKVLNRDGWLYKILFLRADKVISSHADDFIINPFGKKEQYLRDLLVFDFVFLQHGVILNDLSGWLNKYDKNIKLFVTAAAAERESIVNNGYGYDELTVQTTGLARYDLLTSEPCGKIIFAPTWRSNLAGELDTSTNTRKYNADFKSSEYFNFYNTLINDSRLTKVMKRNNLTGELFLHPAASSQIKDFKGNSRIRIRSYPYDYRTAFKEGNLLVTDYSSVAFDFAYLKKPVIYAQFDEKDFYKSHIHNPGYFSCKKQGFGDVVCSYEATVEAIVKQIESGLVMNEKYRKRVDKFFAWNDQRNCQRIYQAVLTMNEAENVKRSVRVPVRFYANHLRNRSYRPIKAFWWHSEWNHKSKKSLWLNFGDELTHYIVWAIWGLSIKWVEPKEAELAATGSILEMLERYAGENMIKIWGSGCMRDGELLFGDNFDFYAVRGPNTASRIADPKRDVGLGDPGLLTNLAFRPSLKKKYRVGVVPHYVDSGDGRLDHIRNNPEYLLIDVLQTPDKVVQDITSCNYVVSSSLHGLIVADSFGIPNNWMPLSKGVVGEGYKFRDYYAATERDVITVSPEILGDDEKIQEYSRRYVPIKNLKKLQKSLIQSFPFGNITRG